MLGTAAAHLRDAVLREPPTEAVVPLCIDGEAYLTAIRLEERELARREALDLGAASSMDLLQALWELPLGLPFLRSSLDECHASVLKEHGTGWVEHIGDHVTRKYEPVGFVTDIATVGRSFDEVLRRVAMRTPASRRIAIVVDSRRHPSARDLYAARKQGIGLIEVRQGASRVLVEPAPATIGRPAVFRWWQAELAYRNLIESGMPTAEAVD